MLGGHPHDDGRVAPAAGPPRRALLRGRRCRARAGVSPCSVAGLARRLERDLAPRCVPSDVCASPGLGVGRDQRQHGADLDRLADLRRGSPAAGRRRAPRRRCRSCRSRSRRSPRRPRPSRRPASSTRRPCPRRPTRPSAASWISTTSTRSSRTASLTSSTWGRTACSSGGENGIGTSGVATPHDRAVEVLQARSAISAATWAPAAHIWFASSTTTTFEHLRTLARIASLVERHERAQVEHLDRRAVEVRRRLERGVHHRAVGDHDEVAALARHARREVGLVACPRAPRPSRAGTGACAP